MQQSLDALLLGQLSRTELDALEAHLAECPGCEGLVDDARLLQRELRLIGSEGPAHRGWDRVAARLEADPEFQRATAATTAPARTPRSYGIALRWVALAATLLVVIGGSLFLMRRSLQGPTPGRTPAGAPAAASPAAIVSSIESELDLAARHYENAIAGLEQVASDGDSPLDPAVMATVRDNLQIIDAAIADSRQALRSDPQSELAQESLFDAFRRKVSLLQDTIALMNEMRKGNQAGATAIASGFNKG